jgi:hypothetical protein
MDELLLTSDLPVVVGCVDVVDVTLLTAVDDDDDNVLLLLTFLI